MKKREKYNAFYGNANPNFYIANKEIIDDLNYRTVKVGYVSVLLFTFILTVITYAYEFLRYLSGFYACFTALFFILTGIVLKPLRRKRELTRYFYYILAITVYMMTIIAGTYFSPDDLAVTFFISLIVVPMIYIEPPVFSFVQISTACIAFGLTTYIVKAEDMTLIQYDIANTFFAYVVSAVVVAYIRNMHIENMKINIRYRQASQIDKLTGLLNKDKAEELSRDYLSQNSMDNENVLLLIDMDDFKKISITIGHTQGDLILKNVGETLYKTFSKDDIVGRLGSDEFLVLARNIEDMETVHKRAELALNRINGLFNHITKQTFTCSVGISAAAGESRSNYDTLILHAEQALNAAKKRGKNEIVFYEEMYEMDSNEPMILLVDDVAINRALFSRSLDKDYMVLQAGNKQYALEYMEKYEDRIVAVLIHMNMAEGDVADLFSSIRKQAASKKLVLLAVSEHNINEYQLASLGADGLVLMPFDAQEVKKKIEETAKFRATL